jgi:hypothetical protein
MFYFDHHTFGRLRGYCCAKDENRGPSPISMKSISGLTLVQQLEIAFSGLFMVEPAPLEG